MFAGIRIAQIPALAIALGVVCSTAGCKIVYNDQRGDSSASAAANAQFDATSYVKSVWDKQVVPHVESKATDLAKVVEAIDTDLDKAGSLYGHRSDAEGSPWSFSVKASGKVQAVNTESRAGTITVDVSGSKIPAVLQIGPVMKGSALRDSLPFFSFGNVTNQIEYAQVGRAFNEQSLAINKETFAKVKAGDTIEFVGAFSVNGAIESVLITPVSVKVSSGGKS